MIYNNAKIFKINNGHILYSEGKSLRNLSIFYLKKGKIEISYKLNNNKNLIVILSEGNFFGLFEALCDKQARITSAKALEESIIYSWKKDDFLMNSIVVSEVGLKAILCLSNFLRNINQKIKEIG